MSEQAILDICNQIAGSDNFTPRFSTLDDIRKQPFIEGAYSGKFTVDMSPEKANGRYSCKFDDTANSREVTIVVGTDGKVVSRDLKTKNYDGSIFSTALVDSEPSTGSTYMQFSNNSIIYTDAKITDKIEVSMGKYSFFMPAYDCRLFDHSSYRELFKIVYDLSDNPEDYATSTFTFHCYINRLERKATMNISQATFGSTNLKPVTVTINFIDGLKLDFDGIEGSKKDRIIDIISPLIDAAI